MHFNYFGIFLMTIILSSASWGADKPKLPKGEQFAVSLSYDDALASQLDYAIPALNKYKLHASFYLYLASPVFANRLEEWRAAAKQGHELANHTLYHVCSASGPDRQWVQPYADLDKRSVEHMRTEVILANSLLQAMDGNTARTFTIPCGDVMASGKNYLPAVTDLFVAIKGQGIEDGSEILMTPTDVSGKDLINFVRSADPSVSVISILFHGVGGDHLSVSTQAHEELLKFLTENRDKYWVDTYINIMSYLGNQTAKD